jgi:hypothetical protein
VPLIKTTHITHITSQGKWSHVPILSTENEQIRRKPLAVLNGSRYLMQPEAAGHTWPAGFHDMASGKFLKMRSVSCRSIPFKVSTLLCVSGYTRRLD